MTETIDTAQPIFSRLLPAAGAASRLRVCFSASGTTAGLSTTSLLAFVPPPMDRNLEAGR